MFIPKNAFLGFCQVYSKFVNRSALITKYLQFVTNYKKIESFINFPSVLHKTIDNLVNYEFFDKIENSDVQNEIDESIFFDINSYYEE